MLSRCRGFLAHGLARAGSLLIGRALWGIWQKAWAIEQLGISTKLHLVQHIDEHEETLNKSNSPLDLERPPQWIQIP